MQIMRFPLVAFLFSIFLFTVVANLKHFSLDMQSKTFLKGSTFVKGLAFLKGVFPLTVRDEVVSLLPSRLLGAFLGNLWGERHRECSDRARLR